MTEVEPDDTHHEVVDITRRARRPKVLMVVANPAISTTLGWPVGFWAAELFHPYSEFTQKIRAGAVGVTEAHATHPPASAAILGR